MSKLNEISIEIISNDEIKKLEKVKELLAEIKSLRDEIFGKQTVID